MPAVFRVLPAHFGESFLAGDEPDSVWSEARLRKWTLGLLLLGVAIRLLRYLWRFPLYPDEAFLAASLLDRGYADLLRPLEYHQVAPPLYLAVQLTIVKLFGFSEYTLRLFSLACGLASLVVFRRLASRLLQGTALLLAVGVFSVSYPLLRYSCEAKPYGGDVLAALLFVYLTVEWIRRPDRTGPLWRLAAITPLLIGLSYPSVFVAGGASLSIGWTWWTAANRRRTLPACCAFHLLLAGSFLANILLASQAQATSEGEMMRRLWGHGFPPLSAPGELLAWLALQHTGDLFSHPLGGPRGGGLVGAVCFAAAVAFWFRDRARSLLLLLVAPFLLSLAAAAIAKYPYGVHVRFTLHLAPAICLGIGLGAAALLAAGPRAHRPLQARLVGAACCVLALCGAAAAAIDAVQPYKTREARMHRDLARWFWDPTSYPGETVCLTSDLGFNFSPKTWEWGAASMYLSNQRIYSPRHARCEPPALDRATARTPLRCALYRNADYAFDQPAYDRWLEAMREEYELVGRQQLPCAEYDRDKDSTTLNHIEVLTFAPRSDAPRSATLPDASRLR